MTYPELLTRIVQWCGKPAASQAVATCVALIEADLDRRLAEAGVVAAQRAATTMLEACESRSAAPGDLRRVARLVLTDDGGAIENVTAAGFAALKADDPDRSGRPDCFTLIGSEFHYYPAPAAACEVELTYQGGVEPLTDDNGSNWVLAAYPDVYFYGGLSRLGGFLGDAEMEARWSVQYERAVSALVEAERDRGGGQRAAAYRSDLPSALTTGCG